MTLQIRANGASLALLASPASEHELALTIGPLDVFLSQHKRVTSKYVVIILTHRIVKVRNATFHLRHISLGLVHTINTATGGETESPIAFTVKKVQGNIGLSEGITVSGEAVGNALLSVDRVKGQFTIRVMREVYLFSEIWGSNLIALIPEPDFNETPEVPAKRSGLFPFFLSASIRRYAHFLTRQA